MEIFTNKVVCERAVIKYEKLIYAINARQIWEASFDPDVEKKQFFSDFCVPGGSVHYRYLYKYDIHKGYHYSLRVKVDDKDDEFWLVNRFWFDYFGPEESEIGLIPYLDY